MAKKVNDRYKRVVKLARISKIARTQKKKKESQKKSVGWVMKDWSK